MVSLTPPLRVLFAGFILAIIASSVAPNEYRPELFAHLDKADHILGYFVLSFCAALTVRDRNAVLVAGALAGLALSLELIQALIPSRDASMRDLAGSFVGIILGMTAGRLLLWAKLRRARA